MLENTLKTERKLSTYELVKNLVKTNKSSELQVLSLFSGMYFEQKI